MKTIDIENWKRKDHFNLFNTMTYPHFNITAPVDISKLYEYTREQGVSINLAIIYGILDAANNIDEFRIRIREDSLIVHDVVHGGPTVLGKDDVFGFCRIEYDPSFKKYYPAAEKSKSEAEKNISVIDEDSFLDDIMYLSAIPWVSFTSLSHPIHISPADSVPRISWGKFYDEGKGKKMPLSVQVSHAVMDGVHVGRFFEKFEYFCSNPQSLLER